MEPIRFSIPCAVSDKMGTGQLESRLKLGFDAKVMIKSPFDNTRAEVLDIIAEHPLTEFHLDVGEYTQKQPFLEDKTIGFLREASKYENVSRVVEAKFGKTIKEKPKPGIVSIYSAEDYMKSIDENISWGMSLANLMGSLGFEIGFENRPRHNYTKISDANRENVKPYLHPAWGGAWSAEPDNDGAHGCNAQEIIYLHKQCGGKSVPLDIEHLVQTCQWGLFSLERGLCAKAGDLSEPERKILKENNLYSDDNDVLWDLRGGYKMDEEECLENYGFIIRQGQPLVYKERLTLEGELDKLATGLNIPSLTPGFQVYQGLAMKDGRLFIGSHMPGIQSGIMTQEQEAQWRENLISIYHLLHEKLITPLEINSIELEPQCYDAEKPVYSGCTWERQANDAKIQTTQILQESLKRTGSIRPEYLRRESK